MLVLSIGYNEFDYTQVTKNEYLTTVEINGSAQPLIKIFMCDVINNGNIAAIICGGHKDHDCDDMASVYETKDGQRFLFRSDTEAKKWYNDNYMHTTMGSVACSICGVAKIDNAWKY